MASTATTRAGIGDSPQPDAGRVPWELLGTAALLSFGRVTYGCEIAHLAPGGAILRCADPVVPWTVVTLRIDRFGKFHGRVLWQRGDSVGLQFLDAARATIQRAATT